MHEVPLKASNNRKAVVVCVKHVMKRPSKRSVLVLYKVQKINLTNRTVIMRPHYYINRPHCYIIFLTVIMLLKIQISFSLLPFP